MSLSHEEYREVRKALHDDMREALRVDMVRGFSRRERDAFVDNVNDSCDVGLLDGLKIFICEQRARQFILWLAHQSLDVSSDCGYCTFLDGIYFHIHAFLDYPYKFHGLEVTTT